MIDNISDKVSEIFTGLLNYIVDRLFYYFDALFIIFINGFDTAGKRVSYSGDIITSHFQKLGFASFTNFIYVFVGFVFVAWAVKAGYKILTKIIEIIGNFTPLT